jgi:hypothetical protein
MKYKNYIRLIAFLFVLILTNRANAYIAVGPGDTLQVQFRVGQSDIDLNYADNERQISQFCQRVWQNLAENEELQLNIYTGASPEGPAELNRRLGEQRGIALKEVLTERLKGLAIHCAVINEGARWGQLYNKVEQSNEPWREDVLTILGKRPGADEWQTDDREQRLRKLKNGLVWRELNDRYLPPLRTSGSAVIFPVRPLAPSQRDTIVIRDTIIYLPEPCPQYEPPIDLDPAWAVKTNLLLWGVIAPNVQVERSLGKTNRWSIEGEIFWPWWTWSHNAHAEQFLNLGVELRYWLGNRQKHHTLDGWHIGMGLAGGYYDIEWKKSEGWQGEYLNVYCNLGYQHRFGRRNQWAVDGGLALGWIPTKFRHYVGSSIAETYATSLHPEKGYHLGPNEEYDDHLMWLNNGWKHIIGATHVNVSIAYIIGAKKKSSSPSQPFLISEYKKEKQAEKEAKAYEKQNEKQIKENTKRAEKNAAEQAKQAEKEVKAAQKEAEAKTKALEADAKAAEKAKQQADKQVQAAATRAEKEAQAQAKAAEKEANAAAKQAEKEAAAMAKEVEAQAKATEKAAAEQAKAAEKAAAEQAKEAQARAKEAEKAAAEQAKAAEKEAAARAKQVEADTKAAEKEAQARAKEAEKAAAEQAKQAEAQAKAAEKEAAARAKQVEADTKAAEKEAQARAKEAEKAAAEQAKQAEAQAKAAEKQAQEQAKAAEKAAAEQAKQAEAQAKAAEKEAQARAKEAEKAAAEQAKQAEAQAKAAEKAAAEQAKQAEAQAKAAEKAAAEQAKQAEAAAKQAEKEAAARAKEAEKAAAEQAKQAETQAKAAEKAAAEQAKQAEAQAKAAEKAAAEQAKAAEKAAAEQAKQAEAAAKQAEKEAAARAKEAEKQAKAAEKEAQAAAKAAKKNANNN